MQYLKDLYRKPFNDWHFKQKPAIYEVLKMKGIRPFLLRFRTHQRVPSPAKDRYDPERDQLIVQDDSVWKPAITSVRYALESKKADIEKGEDQKGP